MADEAEGDILVMVKSTAGLVQAECQERVHGTDLLAKDFKPGFYFQVDSFGFGVNVQEDDSSTTGSGGSNQQQSGGKNSKPRKQKFASWLSNGAAAKSYPVELDEFDFDRIMDMASPVLFQLCCNKETIPSISLIKRKDVGSAGGRDAYLRIDFMEVLLISIDWSTAPAMKEKCKFITRKVLLQYRPQSSSGSLGKVIPAQYAYTFTKTGADS